MSVSAMFCLPPGWDDLHPGRRREHFHRQDFSSHRHQTLHLYCSHHLTLRLIIIMARLFISLFSSSDCVSLLSILYFKPQPILITQLCISLSGLCCISMPIHFQSLTAILFFLCQLFPHFIFLLTGQHIEPSLSQADPSNATYFSFIIISLVLFSFLALFTCLGCCGAAYKSGCMLGR